MNEERDEPAVGHGDVIRLALLFLAFFAVTALALAALRYHYLTDVLPNTD